MKRTITISICVFAGILWSELRADTQAFDIWATLCDLATTLAADPATCQRCQEHYSFPDYYCDCVSAPTLSYGADMSISEQTWFAISASDLLRYGLSTYWFASDSVQIDLLFTCKDEVALQTVVVPANRAKHIDPAELSEMAGSYANLASLASLHLRVTPLHGTTGRMILNKYGEGIHSTCDNVVPLIYAMQYQVSDKENVYQIEPSTLNNTMFVRWTDNKIAAPITYWLSEDDCDGPKVAERTVADSLHLYFPPTDVLQTAKSLSKTLYLHISTEGRGQMVAWSRPKYIEGEQSSETVCYGGHFDLNDSRYTSAQTVYDTLSVARDTCQINRYDISFADEVVKKVNLTLSGSSVKYMTWTFKQAGDYEKESVEKNTGCTTFYQIHVTQKKDVATDIEAVDALQEQDAEWWTIAGTKLTEQPKSAGVYIVRQKTGECRKIVIR